ncbi:hypothetical protein HKX48_002382 [Thoreauomyces humboldtii]|nr:hypothetical protein HKX48_002382 [Thoreauomyces humboldtii]
MVAEASKEGLTVRRSTRLTRTVSQAAAAEPSASPTSSRATKRTRTTESKRTTLAVETEKSGRTVKKKVVKVEEEKVVTIEDADEATTSLKVEKKEEKTKESNGCCGAAVDDKDADGDAKPDLAAVKALKAAKAKAAKASRWTPPDQDTSRLWARAAASSKFVGGHVSAAGGCQFVLENTLNIGHSGGLLCAKSKEVDLGDIARFATACSATKMDPTKHMLPHGSYLINVANVDPVKSQQAVEGLVDELLRCESLGITKYNFHPGAALKEPRDEAIARVADAINRAHSLTKFITVVVENMAGQGTVLGSTFEDLRDIIAGVTNKDRVGVCLDTCHAFAAGYDIRTKKAYDDTMQRFSDIVGFRYLKGMHLNDSKGELGCRKDRHEFLGKGHIGWEAFRLIMNDSRLNDMPLILETPREDGPEGDKEHGAEVIKLYSLVGREEGTVPS